MAIAGNSGVGKSSLINKLLKIEDFLPVDGAQYSTTGTCIEIRNDPLQSNYSLKFHFLNREEFNEMKDNYLNPENLSDTEKDKVKEYFFRLNSNKIPNGNDIDEITRTIEQTEGGNPFDGPYTISCSSFEEVKKTLSEYTSTKHQISLFLEKVEISGYFPSIPPLISIIDLPGADDSIYLANRFEEGLRRSDYSLFLIEHNKSLKFKTIGDFLNHHKLLFQVGKEGLAICFTKAGQDRHFNINTAEDNVKNHFESPLFQDRYPELVPLMNRFKYFWFEADKTNEVFQNQLDLLLKEIGTFRKSNWWEEKFKKVRERIFTIPNGLPDVKERVKSALNTLITEVVPSTSGTVDIAIPEPKWEQPVSVGTIYNATVKSMLLNHKRKRPTFPPKLMHWSQAVSCCLNLQQGEGLVLKAHNDYSLFRVNILEPNLKKVLEKNEIDGDVLNFILNNIDIQFQQQYENWLQFLDPKEYCPEKILFDAFWKQLPDYNKGKESVRQKLGRLDEFFKEHLMKMQQTLQDHLKRNSYFSYSNAITKVLITELLEKIDIWFEVLHDRKFIEHVKGIVLNILPVSGTSVQFYDDFKGSLTDFERKYLGGRELIESQLHILSSKCQPTYGYIEKNKCKVYAPSGIVYLGYSDDEKYDGLIYIGKTITGDFDLRHGTAAIPLKAREQCQWKCNVSQIAEKTLQLLFAQYKAKDEHNLPKPGPHFSWFRGLDEEELKRVAPIVVEFVERWFSKNSKKFHLPKGYKRQRKIQKLDEEEE